MTSMASEWILNVLQPLREVLPTWPVVLPSRIGDPIKPLKIGSCEIVELRKSQKRTRFVMRSTMLAVGVAGGPGAIFLAGRGSTPAPSPFPPSLPAVGSHPSVSYLTFAKCRAVYSGIMVNLSKSARAEEAQSPRCATSNPVYSCVSALKFWM
jgi:hypothetical protein